MQYYISITHANDYLTAKSNQQNIGTIKLSNLCTEIIEYSFPEKIAVSAEEVQQYSGMQDYYELNRV